jgi:hypothetical protein
MNRHSRSRAAALARCSPAPHHQAQLPRAKTALPSPQLSKKGENMPARELDALLPAVFDRAFKGEV